MPRLSREPAPRSTEANAQSFTCHASSKSRIARKISIATRAANSAFPGMGIRAPDGMDGIPIVGRAPPGASGGGEVMPALLSSGREARDVHDLQLDAVRIVEEDRVVPGLVPVLLRAALDLGPLLAQPVRPLVHRLARGGLESEVVEA